MIADAVERGASDIHFDPRRGEMKVRFRVDGVVQDATTVPRKLVKGLVSRVSEDDGGIDISERRLPQDGRSDVTSSTVGGPARITLPIVVGE